VVLTGATPGTLIYLWGSETKGILSPVLPGLEDVERRRWAVRELGGPWGAGDEYLSIGRSWGEWGPRVEDKDSSRCGFKRVNILLVTLEI
jgi:hypothetical protein